MFMGIYVGGSCQGNPNLIFKNFSEFYMIWLHSLKAASWMQLRVGEIVLKHSTDLIWDLKASDVFSKNVRKWVVFCWCGKFPILVLKKSMWTY